MADAKKRTQHILKYTPKAKAFAREQRRNPTINEDRLWQRLRANRLGVHFRRQAPVAGYYLDFAAIDILLDVELDGPTHETPKGRQHDAKRDRVLTSMGFTVLRFKDEEMSKNPDGVVQRIREEVEKRLGGPHPGPPL